MAGLNLWLDSYDDIYSDFDSRHYQKRRISEDFLYELKREMKYQQDSNGDLSLLLPMEKRAEQAEAIIVSSLHEFFTGQYRFHLDKCRQKLKKGVLLLIGGIMLMLFNSWITYYGLSSFLSIALKIVLEPGGWFLIWAAFDFLLYDYSGLKKERDFFQQLSEMHIHFKASC